MQKYVRDISAPATQAFPPSPPSPPSSPPPRRRRRGLYWGAGIGGALILALVVFLILFRWNWLREPLARELSHRLNRPVAITGNLEVHPWSWSPTATINGLVIGNAPWAGPRPLATLPRLTVQVKILPLLEEGKVILPLVEADQPDVGLLRDAQGRANWDFHPGRPMPKLPPINHLIIQGGAVRFADVKRRLVFTGTVSSNEQVVGYGQGRFSLVGQGTFNGERFVAHVTGGPLVDIDPSRPYDFDSHVVAGDTRVNLTGRIDHPFDFAALSGRFSVAGPDLADLYRITGLALPNTPPYSLAAGFARRGSVYALQSIRGRVGQSDLEGAVTVNDSTGRPFLEGDIASRRLRMADLAAVVGGVPKHAAAQALSPVQQIESAKLRAEHRIFPDTHLDVARVRAMDAKVDYRAATVDAGRLPIRALRLKVDLDHGVLEVNPLEMILPQGRLAGMVRLDARRAVPAEALDIRLTNARLETLVAGKPGADPALEGGLYARAKLSSVGDSVRAAAAHANGAVTLVVPNGEIRQTFAELMGIDATRAAYLLLTKSQKETPIRCAVVDFQARDGVLNLDRAILDTGVTTVAGRGVVDLRQETLNLQLKGRPKKFELLRINAPITVKGTFLQPKVGVDIVKAAPQAIISIATGIFAAPVAAILPFVSPGLAKNSDCATLTAEASDKGAPVKAAAAASRRHP
ncbi:MAG TPA: AsmA family protein [Caulobacteraceae bacterium]|nr:AsmA family protein [Caulobacteraceae bacterium]